MSIFKKVKDKIVGIALEKQLKNLDPQQRDMIMTVMQKNPKLFETMAEEIEAKKKAGMAEIYASMQVMREHQKELAQVMMSGNNKAA